jgi:membrane protein required for beta-lactamase induction
VVLQLTVFWYIGAVLGHVCLGLGVLALVTMLLSWVFFFPQWGLGVCVVLWSVGCKSIQFLVHSFNTITNCALRRWRCCGRRCVSVL